MFKTTETGTCNSKTFCVSEFCDDCFSSDSAIFQCNFLYISDSEDEPVI